MAYHHIFGKAALTITWLALMGCASSGEDSGTDQASTGSGNTGTGGTDSGTSSTGNDAGPSSGGASSSATGSAQTNGTGTTGVNSSAGGALATSSANTTDADSSSSGGSCEEVPCLRPYECAESCDVEPTYIGCCPCAEGQIDQFTECNQGGGDCGGASCQADEYCAQPVGECDASDASGSCAPLPTGCSFEYAPVCGCNGVTYGNSCDAASVGVNVASTGECG